MNDTQELLEYYNKEHFKLHFELNHYVHHQIFNGQWLKAKWQDIVTNSRGITRIQYNTRMVGDEGFEPTTPSV